MSKRRRSPPGQTLITTLDPRRHLRVPDHYRQAFRFPGIQARSASFDIHDDGMTSTLTMIFPEGSYPETTVLYGTKRVSLYDRYGRPVIPERYWIETTRLRESASSKPKLISIVPGISGFLTVNPGYIFEACDAIVALDTNTRLDKENETISILGIAIARRSPLYHPKLIHVEGRYAIEFRGLGEPKKNLVGFLA